MSARASDSLVISLGAKDGASQVSIPLSHKSCWANLLGQWPLPEQGALDLLAHAISQCHTPLTDVTLEACPSACLLPVLWLRSIWLAPEATLRIKWNHVDDPKEARGRQAAGRLACLLADEVICNDPDRAQRFWGFATGAVNDPLGESFDLLTNLIDLWDTDLRHFSPAADWAEAARKAFVTCESLDLTRVAIYGAGTHTRALGDVLAEPGVEVVCIIDDDQRRHGDRMWGHPIVSRETALELKPDAVVLSANSIESLLWSRSSIFRDAGIRVARLYGQAQDNIE